MYTRDQRRDHDCGPADTPLRRLTCDESILTHSSASPITDKAVSIPSGTPRLA
jgi:hypothetical protein